MQTNPLCTPNQPTNLTTMQTNHYEQFYTNHFATTTMETNHTYLCLCRSDQELGTPSNGVLEHTKKSTALLEQPRLKIPPNNKEAFSDDM